MAQGTCGRVRDGEPHPAHYWVLEGEQFHCPGLRNESDLATYQPWSAHVAAMVGRVRDLQQSASDNLNKARIAMNEIAELTERIAQELEAK